MVLHHGAHESQRGAHPRRRRAQRRKGLGRGTALLVGLLGGPALLPPRVDLPVAQLPYCPPSLPEARVIAPPRRPGYPHADVPRDGRQIHRLRLSVEDLQGDGLLLRHAALGREGHHGLWRRHLTPAHTFSNLLSPSLVAIMVYGGEPENMRARRRVSSNTIHAGAARGSARLGF